ncbi:unnamed protein product, partial [Amoebophrya sp. A25]
NTDITFNWPENRDRCVCDFAEKNPAHLIETVSDLLNEPRIQALRPTHEVDYSDTSVKVLPTKERVCCPASLIAFLRESLP